MANRLKPRPALLARVLSEPLARCSDRELLERYTATGDQAAFATLVDRHGPMLLGVCRRLLTDAHLADDVVQATFLVLARKARSIRRRDSLAAWLYGVAQRLARQARLAEAARTRRERRAIDNGIRERGADSGWHELLHVLDDELERLPERLRSPLLLCYLEGRTQDEAATHLGWSLSTLRRRLEDGRALLRSRMVRRGATLGAGLFAGFLAPGVVRGALTHELKQSILTIAHAASKGTVIPASIAALATGGTRVLTFTKLAMVSLVAVTLSGLLAGAVRNAQPATEAGEPAVVTARAARADEPQPQPARDRFNDPLPKGAVARLGTVNFRHGRVAWGESLNFTPDGKHLISAGGGWVRRWDLATGFAAVNLGDGWQNGSVGTDQATADGKIARVCVHEYVGPRGGVIWQCAEYDLENGNERRSYPIEFPSDGEGHAMPHFMSPDGQALAELNDSGRITLWNAATGKVTHRLQANEPFAALIFSGDGKLLFTGDEHHTIRVFEVATGKEQRSFGIERGNVVALMALSPDGKWLATAGGQKAGNPRVWPHDRFVRLWDVEKGTLAHTLEFQEESGARSLVFTPDSGMVLAGIKGGRRVAIAVVRSWETASGKPGRTWTDDPTLGVTLAVSPDGKTLATMNENGVIRLWDRESGQEKQPLAATPGAVEAVCFRPGGHKVLTVGADHQLREWDAATGHPLAPPGLRSTGFSPRFAADGKLVVSYLFRDDNSTVVWAHDSATGKLLAECEGVGSLVSRDGSRLAYRDRDNHVRIVDVATGKLVHLIAPPEAEKAARRQAPVPVGFGADGQSLILLGGDALSVWDLRTGKQKSTWSLKANRILEKAGEEGNRWERIEAMAVSPDGSKIAFSVLKDVPDAHGPRSWYGQLKVMDTRTGKLLCETDIHDEAFEQLAFSPDGRVLGCGGARTVRLFDVTTGKFESCFEGHRGRVKSLAFSADGSLLASASEDSTVLVWAVAK